MGGSTVAAALGYSPFKKPDQVYDEMINLIERKDISNKPQIKYGKEAEKYITSLFALEYPQYRVETHPYDILYDPEHPWRRASLDGELFIEDKKGVLEVKTTTLRMKADLAKWTGQIPVYYLVQILWYLGITDYDFAILKAHIQMTNYDDFEMFRKTFDRHYYIDRSEYEGQIRKLQLDGDDFIDHVIKRQRPDAVLKI